MQEQKPEKSIREVLRSRRFQKEIAILLIAFAILQAGLAILLFVGGGSEPENLATIVVALMIAVVYAVLAILIRFGSVSALLLTGILFTADTLLTVLGPLEKGTFSLLFWRGLLIFLLIRRIQKERRVKISSPKLTDPEEPCRVDS